MESIPVSRLKEICVEVRDEAEVAYLIADLIREGVHPQQADLDRLALTLTRMTNVIVALGGDRPVPIREAA